MESDILMRSCGAWGFGATLDDELVGCGLLKTFLLAVPAVQGAIVTAAALVSTSSSWWTWSLAAIVRAIAARVTYDTV